jgi:hypothetical protein
MLHPLRRLIWVAVVAGAVSYHRRQWVKSRGYLTRVTAIEADKPRYCGRSKSG